MMCFNRAVDFVKSFAAVRSDFITWSGESFSNDLLASSQLRKYQRVQQSWCKSFTIHNKNRAFPIVSWQWELIKTCDV